MGCRKTNPCCCDVRIGASIVGITTGAADIIIIVILALLFASDDEGLGQNYFKDNALVPLETFRQFVLAIIVMFAVSLVGKIIVFVGSILRNTKMLYLWYPSSLLTLVASALFTTRGSPSSLWFSLVFGLSALVLVQVYCSWTVQGFINEIEYEKSLGSKKEPQILEPTVVVEARHTTGNSASHSSADENEPV